MIAEGWISIEEMELVAKYMVSNDGDILEVGAANGRLFSYLHPRFPGWRYVAVDPWEQEQVRLQLDWDKGYFEPNNLGSLITEEMFAKNCPFAETHKMYFERFETNQKFDVISMGLVGKNVDWYSCYMKAEDLIKDGGYIIGRNMTHDRYGDVIRLAVDGKQVVDLRKGSFVIKIRKRKI